MNCLLLDLPLPPANPKSKRARRLLPASITAASFCGALLACASAAAQVATAPLACERATVTVFNKCADGGSLLCPPGGTPGMLQKIAGQPAAAVTGGAYLDRYALGAPAGSAKPVYFSYTVPDVRVFAPASAKTLLTPVGVQTWVIKNDTVPGAVASNLTVDLFPGQFSTSLNGQTTLAGSNLNGPWLLVGQVMAKAYMNGYTQYVSYGFSCRLPVANMALVYQ